MEWTFFNSVTLDWEFISGLISVILVNIILSGDNAVVIAMAVRSLPRADRKRGIIIGAAGAVIIRIIFTFFVSSMLRAPYLKFAGGALILWLAIKLFVDLTPEEDHDREAGTIWQALKIIVVADITMSLDNMLGVGAAARGDAFLLVFGLATSIPVLIFASNFLSVLMDKYPIILYIGAALLGKVGAEMMITDSIITKWWHPGDTTMILIEVVAAIGVVLVGRAWARMSLRNRRIGEE
jgi:YjbE family integral membrane protein